MFKKILVPTDGSELSNKAVEGALEYAKALKAEVVGITVQDPFMFAPIGEAPAVAAAAMIEYAEKLAQERVDQFRKMAEAAGVPCHTVIESDPNPWAAIVDAAEKEGCDAIFMASHGRRGVKAVLLGSETHKVLTHSKVPVLVYR